MVKKKSAFFPILCLLALLFSIKWTPIVIPSVSSQPAVKLTVSAAISLKEALGEIKTIYHHNQRKVELIYNLGSSGSLQQQIEQGAPVDIFIAAGNKQMEAMESKNLLLPNSRHNLLTNKLVLIVPKNDKSINKISDLITEKVSKIAIGDPKSVPAGQYTEQTLKYYQLQGLNSKFVYAKDVRQVLSYVETGNVNAGFVYFTDAIKSKQVRMVLTIPSQSHQPIVYPLAIIKDTKNPTTAKHFSQFLVSQPARLIFIKYGFGVSN